FLQCAAARHAVLQVLLETLHFVDTHLPSTELLKDLSIGTFRGNRHHWLLGRRCSDRPHFVARHVFQPNESGGSKRNITTGVAGRRWRTWRRGRHRLSRANRLAASSSDYPPSESVSKRNQLAPAATTRFFPARLA